MSETSAGKERLVVGWVRWVGLHKKIVLSLIFATRHLQEVEFLVLPRNDLPMILNDLTLTFSQNDMYWFNILNYNILSQSSEGSPGV